jgi:amidase
MARTVEDAAIVLGALVGIDPLDPATDASEGRSHTDYTPFLDTGALDGARIGVWRKGLFGFSPETDAVGESALDALRDLGAKLIDPADITGVRDIFGPEFTVLLYEFKADLNAYLADLESSSVRTLAEVIDFNNVHADIELQWFGQELMRIAQSFGPLSDSAYVDAVRTSKRLARRAIRGVIAEHNLDAIVTVTNEAPWTIDLATGDHFVVPLAASTPPAVAGWPHITVPAGFAFDLELPIGLSFIGRAWEEPKVIGFAYAFEQATKSRRVPTFEPTIAAREFVERVDVLPSSSARPTASRRSLERTPAVPRIGF